ncbi:phage holin family protein [Amnibacterium kyonggiense]|uniref:Putative superfamily III holin-X n=1 Tax=Amnibacterium kyonggiense TaxID=595671 RepID=A0A4R7FLL2_9MICO|nr:phage holin family protein [Amnibacterium kyonggiense]TDS77273.1 putative superfamily III holin-X [Amnibacterium kyonggiense]
MADSDTGSDAEKRPSLLRGLVQGVGHEVGDRVRQEIGAARSAGDGNPAHLAQRAAAAAIGGAVGGVGQNVSALLREELGNARREAVASARTAGRGVGLLGAAAAAGNTAGLFVGIAVWRGLGNRIGFAKSALVVAGLSGALAAGLANRGTQELARVRQSTPPVPPVPPATAPSPSPSTTVIAVPPTTSTAPTAGSTPKG